MLECEPIRPTRKRSKSRRTPTEPVKEITSSIDKLFTPVQNVKSSICEMFRGRPLEFLVAKISEIPCDFLKMAEHHLNEFLKVVEGVPISNEVADSLLRGVWLEPCFVRALAATIDVHDEDILGLVLFYANEDSVAERIAHMEADPYFMPSLMGLKEPNSASTLIRLFSSILISHWCDRGLLRTLDHRMGKTILGWRLDLIARARAMRAIRLAEQKKKEVERFSFETEDVRHVKDMDLLRQMLADRYGQRKDIDVEAILEKAQHDLLRVQRAPCYVGKKMEIRFKVTDGCYGGFGIYLLPSDKAS